MRPGVEGSRIGEMAEGGGLGMILIIRKGVTVG
jgi:hypothetical protein